MTSTKTKLKSLLSQLTSNAESTDEATGEPPASPDEDPVVPPPTQAPVSDPPTRALKTVSAVFAEVDWAREHAAPAGERSADFPNPGDAVAEVFGRIAWDGAPVAQTPAESPADSPEEQTNQTVDEFFSDVTW